MDVTPSPTQAAYRAQLASYHAHQRAMIEALRKTQPSQWATPPSDEDEQEAQYYAFEDAIVAPMQQRQPHQQSDNVIETLHVYDPSAEARNDSFGSSTTSEATLTPGLTDTSAPSSVREAISPAAVAIRTYAVAPTPYKQTKSPTKSKSKSGKGIFRMFGKKSSNGS
ncbi:hypothetical protein LTR86_008320 [Recurvomyces mirabilis]|nr:hypothetical protein LTR86_008320 [Recurvomyces mirabilis]